MLEWRPWPKQEFALKQKVFELLYGGSRGPGKTDAGMAWLLKPINFPRYRALVIRKNSEDLKDWLDRAAHMYSGCGGRVVGNPAQVVFDNGPIFRVGHLRDKNALAKYLGPEYQRMLFEELTLIPSEDDYIRILGSCRSTIPGLDARVFATTNPGGPGHSWVKKRFVDICPPMEKYIDPKDGRSRIFVRAHYKDNPTLVEGDPGYVKWLEGLEGDLGKMWRDGSWDVFVGIYFDNFDRDYHVYNPGDFSIPDSWPRFRSIDWGYAAPMACYWHAIGPDQHIYTYKEYYETEKLDVEAIEEIKDLSGDDDIKYTVGDPQSFAVRVQHKSETHLTAIPRYVMWTQHGLPMTLGNSDRVTGWSRMREYLRVRDYQESKSSWWHISTQCVNLIKELTSAMRDKKNPEDVSAESQDHALEACRLGLMSRPSLWRPGNAPMTDLEAAERQHERNKRRRGREIR